MLGSTFSKMGASLFMMSALAGPATVPQSDTSANTDARQWVAARFAGQAPVGVKQGFLGSAQESVKGCELTRLR
jgi:hypothetical protein